MAAQTNTGTNTAGLRPAPQRPTKKQIENFRKDMTVEHARIIQDFTGWLMALDRERFCAVLRQAGHEDVDYQQEKWEEFKEYPLAFVWKWSGELVGVWLDRAGGQGRAGHYDHAAG